VQCFKVLFPDDDLPHDKGGNRTQSSGVMLHRRSQAVKELIIKGPSAVELHRKLSWHAMHSLHATDGVVACHTAHGPCAACQAYCPLLYAALQPRKKGRPAGKGMSCSAMRQLFSSVFCTRCHMSMSYVMLVVKSDTKTLERTIKSLLSDLNLFRRKKSRDCFDAVVGNGILIVEWNPRIS
jgi:hypothetical protein